MNQLQVFKNVSYGEIRTIENGANPLFVATDVAKALGYAKPANAVATHCRCALKRGIPHPQSPDKQIEVLAIPQGDILRLVVKSQLPGAERFESWIFDEVIPSVLKTGAYSAKPMTQIEMLAAQAQIMVDIERKTNIALQAAENAQNRIDGALIALSTPPEADWQTATKNRIVSVCEQNSLSYLVAYGDLYKELEDSARVNLSARVSRLRSRMEKGGATYKERKDISKLHVISLSPQLKLAFDGIVRRFAARYAI